MSCAPPKEGVPASPPGRGRSQGHEEGRSTLVPWEGYRMGRHGRSAEASFSRGLF